ncbi:MAG: hypothetical protein HXX09_10830 [Bacteroidetes bacterium]|nr:hypothetical protein [Bacteroidota bacterium]
MKKLSFKGFCLILFLFCINTLFAQHSDSLHTKSNEERKGNLFSIEPFIYVPYYFLHSNPEIYESKITYKNYWNYGGGLLISNYIGRLKTTTGFYFSSKNYYRDNGTNTLLDKISYWNIPLLFALKTNGKFSPFIGLVFNKPYSYNNFNNEELRKEIGDSTGLAYYSHGGVYLPFIINCTHGWTIEGGLNYKLKSKNRFQLNIKLFADYKLNPDVGIEKDSNPNFYGGHPLSIASGSLSFGIGLNLEIITNKNYSKKE